MTAQEVPMTSSKASSKREQLLNTALELFYREGYHATGIDRILAESGVAKMTLYKHFKSKDELIMAALEERHARTLRRFGDAPRRAPREAILAVCAEHKGFVEAFFRRQLEDLGVHEPGKLARQLQYLLEGVLVMAHMHGPADQALEAREVAETLLRQAGH
jgi:AcrR family transcriptional regulator